MFVRTISTASTLALLLCLPAQTAWSKQIALDVSLDKPTLLAGQKQTAFLKVGLTGFKMAGGSQRAPVNVAIVLDKSGSMSGEKIDRAKQAAIAAIERLGSDDIVSVVAYNDSVEVVLPATKLSDKSLAIAAIGRIEAGGRTALHSGVQRGAEELRKFLEKQRVNRVVLLSDGLANVGPSSPEDLASLGSSLREDGISVSTMGLGLDYHEDLMTRLARTSGGNHLFIENATDLAAVFQKEFDDVLSVVAQELAVTIRVAEGVRPVRVLNMNAEIEGQKVVVQMNQLYSEQERYVVLEVEVPASSANAVREIAQVSLTYHNMQTQTTDRMSSSISVSFSDSAAEVERKVNAKVLEVCVLLIANDRNKQATELRDKGDVEGAKAILLMNSAYLKENADKLNSDVLNARCADNAYQAKNLDAAQWARNRKSMRQQQFADDVQQRYIAPSGDK